MVYAIFLSYTGNIYLKGKVNMNNKNKQVAVIYKSKYGSTKRYAGWIAIKLDADLYEVSDIRDKDLKSYKTIIYGGPLCAGKIKGINIINKNYDKIKNKKIIIFAVGLASEKKEVIEKILENNFSEEIRQNVQLFYLRGAFNYEELGLVDKVMMNMMKKVFLNKKEEELDDDARGMLDAFKNPVDFTEKSLVSDIVDAAY